MQSCRVIFAIIAVFAPLFVAFIEVGGDLNIFRHGLDAFERRYGGFSERSRLSTLDEARRMFYHGYDNYMRYAFPLDELDPINCRGRGPDEDRTNININDVLGDYCLTLVDSLDTLAILGNASEFKYAVQEVIRHVSFDKDNIIQVFEANIRLLGGLLSAHLLIRDPRKPFGDLVPENYNDELLDLASDLATRLLPAFENTKTGIPFPRVNLKNGVPQGCTTHTCTAGAGSLLLEFGMLSRLSGDPVFEGMARRTNRALWKYRSKETGLLGNVIDIQTGRWVAKSSGLGAGLDSFYEYLLKSYIIFGEQEDYMMFNESYHCIKQHMRRGRSHCNHGTGEHPLYVNVDMHSGSTHNAWIDSLQAAFPGLQVLAGDVEEAICAHALFYAIWKMYGALPERFNWQRAVPEVFFSPLRPELIESTYLLYQATHNPFYLHVGREILTSLNNYTKAQCGYATIHNVFDKTLEDRMESYFLSETCKYLYLLFDKDNYVNVHASKFIFTTEGHLFPLWPAFRHKASDDYDDSSPSLQPPLPLHQSKVAGESTFSVSAATLGAQNRSGSSCEKVDDERKFFLPLKRRYFSQIHASLGLQDHI